MKSKELSSKTKDELVKMIEETRKRIEEVRFKAASGGIKNVKELREDKKNVARILTALNK
jgi:ribosomal protein L29